MKTGILIAIQSELQAFLQSDLDYYDLRILGHTVYIVQNPNNTDKLYVLHSGFGEIDAAASTQFLIDQGCEKILNFGVAGALDPKLKIDDLFIVEKVCHYDYDVSSLDPVQPHQYPEFTDRFIPMDKTMIKFAEQACPDLCRISVASGDRFVVDRSFKQELFDKGCQICDMEIAAIARVCFLNRIPCLSIKCISDTYDGDGADFEANVASSAKKAFEILRLIM